MAEVTDRARIALVDSVRTRDLARIGRIVDVFRARGWRYQSVRDYACNVTGLSPSEWEGLMQEVDAAESGEDG